MIRITLPARRTARYIISLFRADGVLLLAACLLGISGTILLGAQKSVITQASKTLDIQINRSLFSSVSITSISSPERQTQAAASNSNKTAPGTPKTDTPRILIQDITHNQNYPAFQLRPSLSMLPALTEVRGAPMPVARIIERFQIRPGDTLGEVLERSELQPRLRSTVLASLTKSVDALRIHPGQHVELSWTETQQKSLPSSQQIEMVRFLPDDSRVLALIPTDTGFRIEEQEHPIRTRQHVLSGGIQRGLYEDSLQQGLSLSLLSAFIDIFSSDIDFQREIHPGNAYAVYYITHHRIADGKLVNGGDILSATLETNNSRLTYYRYQDQKGHIDYFNDDGESARRTIVKTPIAKTRISSRFGKRRHPILGFTRQHNGVDFAVPPGTRVYSAGKGRIVYAGRNKGYGIYVKIRHPGGYATAYAHLSRIAKGIRKGVAVSQGHIIAFSGNTGLSTGPHLHYEVHRNGIPVNPLKLKLPRVAKLKGEELNRFHHQRDDLIAHREALLVGDDTAYIRP